MQDWVTARGGGGGGGGGGGEGGGGGGGKRGKSQGNLCFYLLLG
ncbi:hypothetical protein E2C01_061931 [Portunus trituberculatus]|uniref:Uncharacterized protein n=1 Tax=Portunus trituberculatus TaxID=210409 RepID=A0A5B7HFQ4_PORTR|nr:hypothetical protein [Portunus trituberculatus]